MSRDANPPFPRGKTFYDGNTIDSNNLGGVNLEGKEWVFEDVDPRSPVGSNRTNRYVRCRIVRNVSAGVLLPKFLVGSAGVGGNLLGRVDGKTTTTAQNVVGAVDEYLPAAGVPVNDLFWLVIKGPALITTAMEGDANNLIPVDTKLVALTGVTSGSTTSGRPTPQVLTGATAVLAAQVQGVFARALSAKTTANTNADILVEMNCFW
jgi:hypothetical protein